MMKNKALKFIAIILLANLALVNFVFAQTPTTTPPADIIITNADFIAAQASETACTGTSPTSFKNKVFNVTQHEFKANWAAPATNSVPGVCAIVGWEASDGATGIFDRGQSAINLEQKIKNGKGVSANDIADARVQSQKEQTDASGPSKVVGWFLKSVFDVINSVIGVFTAFAMRIMSYAVEQVVDVTEMPLFVKVGWGIVRDFANMFFILILIVIALGSILRIKEYSEYGHLIVKLIIAALLVNFSQVIAVTIMNAVNLMVAIFVVKGDLKEIFSFVYSYIWQDVGSLPNGWMTGLTQGITMTVFSIVMFGASLMLAGLFVVRLVGLYILVIFSPVAYVLNILPGTEHYAKEWWQYFIKYLIWAPVAMFLIRIDVLLVNNYGLAGGPGDSAFKYIFLSALMVAAVLVAQQAGMVGSNAIISGVQKGMHAGAEFGDKWLARGANRKAPGAWNTTRRGLSYLSVGALQKGWKQRSAQVEHESYLVASAERQDVFNKALSGFREKSNYGLKAEQQLVADEKKKIHTQNNVELIHGMDEALEAGKGEEAFANAEKLFENYDGNEILSQRKYGTDHEGFQRLIDDKFVPLMGKEKAYRLAYDLSRKAEEAGHWNFARAYKSEVGSDGQIHYEKNENAEKEVLTEILKLPAQQADRGLNRLGRGFVEIDTEVEEVPETEIVDGEVRFKRDASGAVIKKKGRINLGVAAWGRANRKTIDPEAAGKTFNANTTANYMFNDSKGTFEDNKPLWLALANKVSKMSDQQMQQTRSLISSAGMEAGRDAQGHLLRYSEADPEVVSGNKKAGQVKYRIAREAEVKDRVFTVNQANDFYEKGEFTLKDLRDAKHDDLINRINEYRGTKSLGAMK